MTHIFTREIALKRSVFIAIIKNVLILGIMFVGWNERYLTSMNCAKKSKIYIYLNVITIYGLFLSSRINELVMKCSVIPEKFVQYIYCFALR